VSGKKELDGNKKKRQIQKQDKDKRQRHKERRQTLLHGSSVAISTPLLNTVTLDALLARRDAGGTECVSRRAELTVDRHRYKSEYSSKRG